MITVEFIGPSGAGKSTLVAAVRQELARRELPATEPLGSLIGSLGDPQHNERRRIVLLDLLVFPWSLQAAIKYFPFSRLCLSAIVRSGVSPVRAALLFRSVLRKLGVYLYFKRRHERRDFVLVDEGTVHAAHVIYLNGGKSPSEIAIDSFCQYVPLPDRIVYVSASKEELRQRVLARSDKPVRGVSESFLCRFVDNARDLFEQIAGRIEQRCPVYRVNFSQADIENVNKRAHEVVNWIMSTP